MSAAMPGAEAWSHPGEGERGRTAVLLIHGFTANPRGFRPLGERLAAEGYRVELPLLPGHGTSPRDLATTRYADWVAAVEAVLDRLGADSDRVVLVGHSMGGTIALDVASRRIDDVERVVVINPLLREPRHLLAKLSPVLAAVVPLVPRDLAGMPTDDIARLDVEEGAYALVAAKAARSLIAELRRVRSQLLDLSQPLLVIRSPQDHTVPCEDAEELMELVGSRELRELVCHRSFHVPQIDLDADLVEAEVLAFLAASQVP